MVRREQIVNNIGTTLNGAINDSVLSATLTDGSVFPAEGDYRLKIEAEVMLVTARSGDVVTIERGVDGTAAASHGDGISADAILSAEGLTQYFDGITGGASARNPLRLLDGNNVTLIASDFSWVNQGTCTVIDDAGGGITIKVPPTSGGWRLQVMTAPSTPYTITAKFVAGPGFTWSASGSVMGLVLRESSTSKFMVNYYQTGDEAEVSKYTNETTFNSVLAGVDRIDCDSPYWWQQIEDDGTDLKFRVGTDGTNWWELGTEGRTVWMAGGPNQVGWAMPSVGLLDKLGHLKAWYET